MIHNLPILIILVPLGWALMSVVVGQIYKRIPAIVTPIVMAILVILSGVLLREVIISGEIHYYLGGWKPPFGIEFVLDPISSLIICLISVLGFITSLYSYPIEYDSEKIRISGYYALLSLLTTGLIGMTATGDVFNFYVFLEITSLTSYGLVAMGKGQGVISAFRYLVIGTIGASFYLLGVAFLYGETGSLNMSDIASILSQVEQNPVTVIVMAMMVIGFGVKMALFPLHGWQPAAYSNAHIGAAPMISGVMAKVPAYAMVRFFLFMFNDRTVHVKEFLVIIGILSSVGIIYGSLKAITQTRLSRIMAYSSIAQIGYIGMGIAIGNAHAILGALLHIFYHSITKSGLFFAVGALKYKYGINNLDELGQIYKKTPITSIVIILGGLSMIGIPPTVGFFSKWYIALGAMADGGYIYVGVLVISTLLNAVYFFRIIENLFMNKEVEPKDNKDFGKFEMPLPMLVSLVIMGILIAGFGLLNLNLVDVLMETVKGATL